jgi:hypothetical protein
MNAKLNLPMTEKEKQIKPLEGETSPEDAFIKARVFATIENLRLKNSRSKMNT